ncbi:DUF4350 domain-containing protein [Deinococcus pimensis]|uniref:DUF4350 domain-containing protein n=1 Tax=Deinococcus pimensis TaxID=309888 RepID=UPI000481E686|nr:DUF4350 domain-containing protein [Deinococcus pimensis]
MRDHEHPKFREQVRDARARLQGVLATRLDWREDDLVTESGLTRAVVRAAIEELCHEGTLRPYFVPRHGHPSAMYRVVTPRIPTPRGPDREQLPPQARVVLEHLRSRNDTLLNIAAVLHMPSNQAHEALELLQAGGHVSCRYVGSLAIFSHEG